jgi:prophage maintenance system killer protein
MKFTNRNTLPDKQLKSHYRYSVHKHIGSHGLSGLLDHHFNRITYREAVVAIRRIKRNYEKSGFFAKEKGTSFRSALRMIYQTYDGQELYPSPDEKAAHLLYFVLKNQAFFDGNKRIAVFMFIWFLHRNKMLYYPDGSHRFNPQDFVYLAELVSNSTSSDKRKIISQIKKFIRKGGLIFVEN